MRLVCGITTKDEEWIINKTLSILTNFCYKIVILDDNSTDNTLNIAKKYKNVCCYNRKPRDEIWKRNEAEGLLECFNLTKQFNPDYILMLDADEIPTPNFINFINNIDTSINAWSVRMINLYKDEKHYRTDNFITKTGVSITHDPFKNNGWRKTVLVKYLPNFNYTYNLLIQKGGTSKNHPSPENIPEPIKQTEEFYIIHYGRLGKKFLEGEKDKFYALIEHKDGKGSLEDRLLHQYLCRTGSGPNGPQYKECNNEWFW